VPLNAQIPTNLLIFDDIASSRILFRNAGVTGSSPVSGTVTTPEQTWKTAEICGKLLRGGPTKSHYVPPWPTQRGPRTLQEAWPHADGCADPGAETGSASLQGGRYGRPVSAGTAIRRPVLAPSLSMLGHRAQIVAGQFPRCLPGPGAPEARRGKAELDDGIDPAEETLQVQTPPRTLATSHTDAGEATLPSKAVQIR